MSQTTARQSPSQALPPQPKTNGGGKRHVVLLVLTLALGFFARTWEYGRLPPGLNPDEASTGVEARSLLNYGEDRNGISYPVKFISWGSGQDVLYAYLLIPLISLAGLSPFIVRLPMLGFALATLPLTYVATRRVFGAGVALMATFMLAISPWHILLSRWALDSNLFPFAFLAAFACLITVRESAWWFVPGCALLALCLYTYGTAYVVIPVFITGAALLFLRARWLRNFQLWSGLAVFAILAAPIALLVIVNRFGLSTLQIGPLTVPHFPVAVRWESVSLLGASEISGSLLNNLATALRLLVTESDSISYNVVDPYGIFYRFGLVLTIAGIVLMLRRRDVQTEGMLLWLWLGAALCIGLLSPVNVNRFNILFIPMLMLGAYTLYHLQTLHRALGLLVVLVLLIAFSAFTWSYHGKDYRGIANFKFQAGLLPALLYAQGHTAGPICVTDEINMPYIYALFTDPVSPAEFQASLKYVDSTEPLRRIARFGRYDFGVSRCRDLGNPTYIMRVDETAPRLGNRYASEFFDNFVVYSPIQ